MLLVKCQGRDGSRTLLAVPWSMATVELLPGFVSFGIQTLPEEPRVLHHSGGW